MRKRFLILPGSIITPPPHTFYRIVMKKLVLALLIMGGLTSSAHAQLRAAGNPVLVFDDVNLKLQQPVPSPDGQTIALTTAQFTGIWIVDRNGGNLRQISTDQNVGFGMKWTADASAIVGRTSQVENRRRSFAVMEYSLDGQSTQLSDFMAHMPTTPVVAGASSDVIVATQQAQEVIAQRRARQISSDSATRATAHANGQSIWLWDQAGNQVASFNPFPSEDTQYLNAVASPDGSKIAFEVYGGNLFVLDVSGGGLTDHGQGYRPSWSPDGQYITFMRNTDDGYRFLSGEIVAARADGSETVVLHAGTQEIPTNPMWDTVSNRVYFNYVESGSILYIDVITE
jgi:Tol biopolymer transport system component